MANIRKKDNIDFWDKLTVTFTERLKELGITKYALCRDNNFSRNTCDRIVRGLSPVNVNTLIEYLDAVGLELTIKKKDDENN